MRWFWVATIKTFYISIPAEFKMARKTKTAAKAPKKQSPARNLPAIISGLWVLTLVLSIVYDYAFFRLLGTNFSELPTTLPDHLRSSLIWIPLAMDAVGILAVPMLILLLLIHAYIKYSLLTDHARLDKLSADTKKNDAKLKAFKPNKNRMIATIRLLMLVASFRILKIRLFFTWVRIRVFRFLRITLEKVISINKFLVDGICFKKKLNSTIIFIAIFFAVFSLGYHQAIKVRLGQTTEFVFEINGVRVTGSLARSFENYFLIWDSDKKQVLFVSRNQVSSFYPAPKLEQAHPAESDNLQ